MKTMRNWRKQVFTLFSITVLYIIPLPGLFPDKVKRRQEGSDEDNEELEEAGIYIVFIIPPPPSLFNLTPQGEEATGGI